jgi:hypothetical protein
MKKKKVDWTEGVAQTIGCLLCKHKVLSSNPSATKKKRLKKKKEEQSSWE